MSGRGRGKNAWISPLGCLQFSCVLSLPASSSKGLVFVQYLAALAIVEAVRGALGPEYAAVGRKLRIKWPNDVYADVGGAQEQQERKGTFEHRGRRWAKCAGVLINSQFAGKDFKLIAGESAQQILLVPYSDCKARPNRLRNQLSQPTPNHVPLGPHRVAQCRTAKRRGATRGGLAGAAGGSRAGHAREVLARLCRRRR